MKHVSITCDCCKNVLEDSTEKKLIQLRSTISDSTAAYDLIKVWEHVCPTCFSSLKLRIKQTGSLSEQITNESKEKSLLEKALEINKKIAEAKGIEIQTNNGANVYVKSPEPLINYNWAENIADAWELFEELVTSQQGWRSVNLIGNDCAILPRYRVSLVDHDANINTGLYESAETAPLAVCKAWLAWKENKK